MSIIFPFIACFSYLYIYNLNVRFITIFVKIILISYLLMFYRHFEENQAKKTQKSKQEESPVV